MARQSISGGMPASAAAGGFTGGDTEMDDRYKEINKRLRRLLAEERKSLQTVRQNYAVELAARTEMELLLRKCVEDVRKEIARRRIDTSNVAGSELVRLYSRNPGAIPVDDFTQEDRERALELLLSQERVVTLLYAKTFPVSKHSAAGAVAASVGSSAAGAALLGQDFLSTVAAEGTSESSPAPAAPQQLQRPSTAGAGGLLPAIPGAAQQMQRPQTSEHAPG